MSEMQRLATEPELEAFAKFLARITLEVERNLRGPDQLIPYMSPQGWQMWHRGRLPGGFAGGTVTKADIGRPRLERIDDRRVIANVVTRTDAHRWGALTMKLDASTGRWRAASLQRLYAARHYRTGPQPPVVDIPVERRLDTARTDRQQAASALRAIDRRRSELPTGSPAGRETAKLSTTWKTIVAELDREIVTLQQQQTTAQTVTRHLHRTR